MFLFDRAALVLLCTLTVVISRTAVAEGPPKAAKRTAKEVIETIDKYYATLNDLKGLEYSYIMTTTRLLPNSSVAIRWDEIKATQKVKGNKRYTTVEGVDKKDKQPLDDKFCYDGNVARWLATASNNFAITKALNVRQGLYSFLPRIMFLRTENELYNDSVSDRQKIDADSFILPEGLTRHSQEYTLRTNLEDIEHDPCYVLERPGKDILWVDCDKTQSLRKRELYWKENNKVRYVVRFNKHTQVTKDLWFPTVVDLECYTAPWDNASMQGKVAYTQQYIVKEVQESNIPDAVFSSLEPPVGAMVFDERTNTQFVNSKQSTGTVFDQAIGAANGSGIAATGRSLFWKVNALILIAVAVFLLWRAYLRK